MPQVTWIVISSIVAFTSLGCQGSGSRSSLLSPAKVPSPPTSSYGTTDKNYYNNGNNSGGNNSGGSNSGTRTGSGHSSLDRPTDDRVVGAGLSDGWQPSKTGSGRDAGVATASFAGDDSGAGIGQNTGSLTNRLRGMRTNDATRPNPPSERVEITDLPAAGATLPPRRMAINSDEATAGPLINEVSDDERFSRPASPSNAARESTASRRDSVSSSSGESPLRWGKRK